MLQHDDSEGQHLPNLEVVLRGEVVERLEDGAVPVDRTLHVRDQLNAPGVGVVGES